MVLFALRAPYRSFIAGSQTGQRDGGTSCRAHCLASALPSRFPSLRLRLAAARRLTTRRRARHRLKASSRTRPCTASPAKARPPTSTPSSSARANRLPPQPTSPRPSLFNLLPRSRPHRFSRAQPPQARRDRVRLQLRRQLTDRVRPQRPVGCRNLPTVNRLPLSPRQCRSRSNPRLLRQSRTFRSPTASRRTDQPPISTPPSSDRGTATANRLLHAR